LLTETLEIVLTPKILESLEFGGLRLKPWSAESIFSVLLRQHKQD